MGSEYFSDELVHFGIKRRSGRYPWGSGERPYQSGGGGGAPVKKSRKQKKADQKAAKQAEEQRRHNEEKPAALQKGSASDIQKYLGELTNQELRDVATRLNLEKQIKDMSAKETKSNMQKVDKAMQTVRKIDEWAKIGTTMYNTIVTIYNITEEGRKHPMKRIG